MLRQTVSSFFSTWSEGFPNLGPVRNSEMYSGIGDGRFAVAAVLLYCGMAMRTRGANASLTSSGTQLALPQHSYACSLATQP